MLDEAQNSNTFSNFQAAYKKKLCLLFEKSDNFFQQSERTDWLDPPPSTCSFSFMF